MPIAVHMISFRGLAGSVFICTVISLVLYVIAFATNFWLESSGFSYGLWENCRCSDGSIGAEWFKAVQAMITIGLIGLVICMVFISLYMCVHSISKNTTIVIFVVVAFIAVVFMLIGFVLIGTKGEGYKLKWSFMLSVVGSFFCLLAGILGIAQMRSSGV